MDEMVISDSLRVYECIRDLAESLTGTGTLEEKLDRVVTELRRITQADGTSIWLIEGRVLRCIAGKGHYEDTEKGKPIEAKYHLDNDKGLTAWIAKSGKTVNIRSFAELEQHPQWAGKYDDRNYPARDRGGRRCESFIGTPLKIGNTIIGVLKADNRQGESGHPGYFPASEEHLFTILAALIAIVIKNDQIQRTQAEIEARQRIAAIAVHNLENPAIAIRWALENIRDALAQAPPRLDLISRSVEVALDEVDILLEKREAFLLLINPRHSEEYRETDVAEFVERSLTHAKRQAPDVNFGFEGDPRVRQTRLPVAAVSNALSALLANAIDATRGRQDRQITVRLRCEKDFGEDSGADATRAGAARMYFDVEDNGHGVEPRIKDRLFDVGATTKELGAGLGLYACQHLMRSIKGDVMYDPSYRGGARFVIVVPSA